MRKLFYLLPPLALALASPPALAQQKKSTTPKPKTVAAAPAASGARLVETVTRKPGELVIPYAKYVLPNGLTVVVTEDHSDPLVHVDVTYHVGSAREQIGKSGFAHFFEHMMFEGSDNAPTGLFDKLILGSGGTNNGSTNQDRTNYYETIPNNQLETALWLEADRMGFLLDAVDQKKFEIQRATVKNERGQNYDNRPYGLASEYVSKTLYPYGHPYSWLTIGYLKDLDVSNVNDLKNFFLRWYGPNNATLTVGGDVGTAQVLKLAQKYFGSIPRGPAVPVQKLPEPVLAADRYVSYEDNVRFPALQLVFPTVPRGHPDEMPLDALAQIIGGGKSSLLYKNLVKPQKAQQAQAFQRNSELSGEFTLFALALPGQRLDSTAAIVRQTLAEAGRTGITDAEVARFKASTEAQYINNLSSVSGKVTQLAADQTFFNNPNHMAGELKQLRALTRADVQRAFNKYIQGKHAVVLSVVPKGKPDLVAGQDNYVASPAGYVAPNYGYEGLKYVKATDTFDRSKQPRSGPNPVVKVPALYQDTFANGLKVVGTRNTEIPAVTMQLSIRGGHRLEQANLGQAGLAALTASMLNEGTAKYSGEDFSGALDKLGSTVRAYADADNTTVAVQSLTKNLPATLALVQELLLHPRFAQADFDRVKKQTLESIANQTTQPVVIANNTYSRLLYGPGSIMSVPAVGTTASVGSFTLDDVKAFYNANYAPNVSSLVIVGDVAEADVLPQLDFLKTWAKKDVSVPATVAAGPQPDKTRVYFVDKPGAAQSEIRVGYLTALPYDATGDYYRAYLTNYALGGSYSSRINLNLRQNKGYTYGASSGFRSTRYPGPFTAQAGVRADATAASIKEFMSEINGYRTGITPEELSFLQTSIGQSDALKYETGQQKAQFLTRLVEYNLQPDYVDKQGVILKNLTAADIQTYARKNLPENMYIVVVGDKKQLPAVQALGYEVVELDNDGQPVPAALAPAAAAAPAPTPMPAEPTGKVKRKTKTADGKTDKTKEKTSETK